MKKKIKAVKREVRRKNREKMQVSGKSVFRIKKILDEKKSSSH